MMVKQEKEPILVRIDEAARELLDDRPDGIIPVSGMMPSSVANMSTKSTHTEPSSHSSRSLTYPKTIVQLCAFATTRSTTLAPRPGTCIGSSMR